MDKDMKPEPKVETSKKDLLVSLSAMLGAIGYTAGYALRFPEEKVSVTFKRWFDEQIANAKASEGQEIWRDGIDVGRRQSKARSATATPPWDGVVNPADFKTETYRDPGAASGFIPQPVSGVRVTHIPTGLVEACHDSRTSGANKETAWQRLLSRLRGVEPVPQPLCLNTEAVAVSDAQKLATAIAEAATRMGLTDASKHAFSGPHLLLLLDSMEGWAKQYDRLQPYLCKTCSGYGAVGNILTAEPCPECALPAGAAHSDDVAVDRFAVALKEKLAKARAKGRGGWESCHPGDLSRMLREHTAKGDPIDVANFCLFLYILGQPITPVHAEDAQDEKRWHEVLSMVRQKTTDAGQRKEFRLSVSVDAQYTFETYIDAAIAAQETKGGK